MKHKFSQYNNKHGVVTAICENYIEIDGDMFLTERPFSKLRIKQANPCVGDKVSFNFIKETGDLIYLFCDKNIGFNFREAKYKRYVEDPRDPDECHDMAMIYGSGFSDM